MLNLSEDQITAYYRGTITVRWKAVACMPRRLMWGEWSRSAMRWRQHVATSFWVGIKRYVVACASGISNAVGISDYECRFRCGVLIQLCLDLIVFFYYCSTHSLKWRYVYIMRNINHAYFLGYCEQVPIIEYKHNVSNSLITANNKTRGLIGICSVSIKFSQVYGLRRYYMLSIKPYTQHQGRVILCYFAV